MMSWELILKSKALVGKKATSPNIWLHRKATTKNLGRPMKVKPEKLSTIPIQVPEKEFERYYGFFADFYSKGGWEMYSQGSLQQGLTNTSVQRVINDFERGKIKSYKKYSNELDEQSDKLFSRTIKSMKATSVYLTTYSRNKIREGRDMLKYANDLERSYDRGR